MTVQAYEFFYETYFLLLSGAVKLGLCRCFLTDPFMNSSVISR